MCCQRLAHLLLKIFVVGQRAVFGLFQTGGHLGLDAFVSDHVKSSGKSGVTGNNQFTGIGKNIRHGDFDFDVGADNVHAVVGKGALAQDRQKRGDA